jgi:hypothetical protein
MSKNDVLNDIRQGMRDAMDHSDPAKRAEALVQVVQYATGAITMMDAPANLDFHGCRTCADDVGVLPSQPLGLCVRHAEDLVTLQGVSERSSNIHRDQVIDLTNRLNEAERAIDRIERIKVPHALQPGGLLTTAERVEWLRERVVQLYDEWELASAQLSQALQREVESHAKLDLLEPCPPRLASVDGVSGEVKYTVAGRIDQYIERRNMVPADWGVVNAAGDWVREGKDERAARAASNHMNSSRDYVGGPFEARKIES